MEAILLLLIGYFISRTLSDDGHKKKNRPKRHNTTFFDDSSYSAYDCWRKSHGDQNKLF